MADDPRPGAPKSPQPVRLGRGKNFRVVFSNTFRFRVGAADIGIAFGYQTELPPASAEGSPTILISDEVEVVLTPMSLKLLQLIVADNVEAYEAATGKTIELPQSILETLADQKAKMKSELTEELKNSLKPPPPAA